MSDANDDDSKPSAQVIRISGFQKADPLPNATQTVVSNSFESEDEFQGYYLTQQNDQGLIEPPYNLKYLDRLTQENNALGPCIEAMVTNIDGTDFDFEADDEDKDDAGDDKNKDELWEFFLEPWPGISFITMRKHLRRDLERTGNAYLEVIRNASDEIVFFKHVDAKMVRLVKLDDAVTVQKTVTRKGREVTINVQMRERRYAQMLGGKSIVYFKEFGSQRDLSKVNGKWATKGERLGAQQRATELIHFTCLPDAHTPYGVPRWINQTPSVLGSRKAEEFNLDFFDNGGVPPVMIMLQGGILSAQTRDVIEKRTSGPAVKKNRIQVIEAEPTGGSLDSAGTARITVERFGSERQSDSMFEKYDDKCEVRVRRAFRLPPIFVGAASDYNFATAFASYTVAEAQVFKPERDEFDEIMSIKVLPAMGYTGYRMRSLALNIEDAALKLKGIEQASKTNRVEPEEIVMAINETIGTAFKVTDEPVTAPATYIDPETGLPVKAGNKQLPPSGEAGTAVTPPSPGAPKPTPTEPPKVQKSEGIIALATDVSLALRKRDMASLQKNMELVETLPDYDRAAFRQALSTFQFLDPTIDPDGLAELAGCTLAVMAANGVQKEDCGCGTGH